MKTALGLGVVFAAGLVAASHAGVPEEKLAQAVKENEHAAIKSLLAAKADPNAALPTPRMRKPAPDEDCAGEKESDGAMV